MKVSCPACDSKYTIADEKVLGRKVKVRCKSCGGQILINGTIPPPPNDSPDAEGAHGADNAVAAEGKSAADDDATQIYDPATAAKIVADAASDGAKSSPEAASKSSPKSSPQQGATKSAPRQSAPTAVPVIDDGIIWSVNVSESDERSLPTHDVVAGYLSGEFAGEVYVWHDGMADWATIPDVPQLAAAIEAAKKGPSKPSTDVAPAKQKVLPTLSKGPKGKEAGPPPSDAGAKKAAARASGAKRPQSAHDLFAATSSAGSESDVTVTEEEDAAQKLTGARNENSVLFSLDALKAGITASPAQAAKPSGKKAPAAPRKKLEDIMSDVGSPLAAGPAASPLLLSANQSLLTAPAPPPPKPKPEPVVVPSEHPAASAAAAAAAINYAKEKEKTKRMLIAAIAGIVAVGAIAGIAIAMTKGKTESAPVASASVAPPVASATVAAATPAPTPAPAAEEPKPAEEAKPAESAGPATEAKKPTAVTQPGKTTPTTPVTPGKTEPKKETTKKEEPAAPSSSGVASFNKEAAAQALAVAASQTSICKKPDGPTGQGKVQVTFAPSGRATTANIVSGPFGGTAVGGCVSGVFKRARVPAFSGDPVTVSKSFSIVP